MTYEEAKEILLKKFDKSCGNYFYQNADKLDYEEALFKGAEAIEKQIPKKPIGKYTQYRCSVCGTRVRSGKGSSSRTKDTVCRNCFQVLDWSEE